MFFLEPDHFALRVLGLGACAAAIYLVGLTRNSATASDRVKGQTRGRARGAQRGQAGRRAKEKKRPGRRLWALSLGLLPLLGASYVYLYQDGLRGYPDALPIYLFCAVSLVCVLVWSYMTMRVW